MSGMQSDREEGEISEADESENVRLRIKELEEKNDELEKIEKISSSYNALKRQHADASAAHWERHSLKCIGRPQGIPLDASSISSDETFPTKRHKKRRAGAKYKSRHKSRHFGSGLHVKKHGPSKRYVRKKRVDLTYNDEANGKRISWDSQYSSEQDTLDCWNSTNLIRDKLRFALARSPVESTAVGCLKDRLHKEKHFAKSRDATPPTPIQRNDVHFHDTTDLIATPDDIDSDNSISLEEQELRLIALKSAVMKKHLARKKRNAEVAYSPTDFIMLDNSPSDDNIDIMNMDICDYNGDMDVSPSSSPLLVNIDPVDPENCKESICYNKPIDMDIANSDSETEGFGPLGPCNKYLDYSSQPGPDMPFSTFHFTPVNDSQGESQSKTFHSGYSEDQRYANSEPGVTKESETEEEEAALRALLLSKLPSAKSAIRSERSGNIAATMFSGPTESILKEAVRRLTVKTNFDKEAAAKVSPRAQLESPQPDVQVNGLPKEPLAEISSIENCIQLSEPLKTTVKNTEEGENGHCGTHGDNLNVDNSVHNSVKNSVHNSVKYSVPNSVKNSVPNSVKNAVPNSVNNSGRTESSPCCDPTPLDDSTSPNPEIVSVAEVQAEEKPLATLKQCENVKSIPKPSKESQPPRDKQKEPGPQPAASSTVMKIVKPNKVINKFNQNVKRKVIATKPQAKKTKVVQPTKSTEKPDSRLLTPADIPKIQVQKLVISLGESDSTHSSEEEEDELAENSHTGTVDRYDDNASPLSLALDTHCHATPAGSNTPSGENEAGCQSPIPGIPNNEIFEKKLDNFLRNVRTTLEQTQILRSDNDSASKRVSSAPSSDPSMAVRHLPRASQIEYRKLIHRMKILEDQRLGKCAQDTPKNSLQEKQVVAPANRTSSRIVPPANTSSNAPSDPSSKISLLKTYEKSFARTGTVIISNLEKSMKLVDEIRRAKISKLQQEDRLAVLHAQLEEVQRKYKQDHQVILKLSPSISSTNNVITTLKQRMSKFQQAAKELGRTVYGENYRLNDVPAKEVSVKLRKLASDIKLVNSINTSYVKKLERSVPCASRIEKQKIPLKCNENTHAENSNLDRVKESVVVESIAKDPTPDQTVQEHLVEEVDNPEAKDTRTVMAQSEETSLMEYISPLEHINYPKSQYDPNGIMCPYDLRGCCEDEECKFEHFSKRKSDDNRDELSNVRK